MQELHNNISVEKAIESQLPAGGSDVTGEGIDTQGCHALEFVANVGAGTPDGTNHLTFEFEKAPDDGTGSAGAYVKAVDDDMLGDVTLSSGVALIINGAALDDLHYKYGIRIQNEAYRFWRMNILVALSPAIHIGVTAVKGRLEQVPEGGI